MPPRPRGRGRRRKHRTATRPRGQSLFPSLTSRSSSISSPGHRRMMLGQRALETSTEEEASAEVEVGLIVVTPSSTFIAQVPREGYETRRERWVYARYQRRVSKTVRACRIGGIYRSQTDVSQLGGYLSEYVGCNGENTQFATRCLGATYT